MRCFRRQHSYVCRIGAQARFLDTGKPRFTGLGLCLPGKLNKLWRVLERPGSPVPIEWLVSTLW